MSINGHRPLRLTELHGLHTLFGAENTPPGFSPDCPDVEFLTGFPKTRRGLDSILDTGSVRVLHLSEYSHGSEVDLLSAALDVDATLQVHDALTLSSKAVIDTQDVNTNRLYSDQAFNARYFVGSVGKNPRIPPFIFDGGTDIDLFSPPAPQKGTVLTAADSGVGNIPAGAHKVAVIFEFASGHRMITNETASWTAAGGAQVQVQGIPTGPPYVRRRILAFTIANGGEFYFISGTNMVIDDNTTTTRTVDFTDQNLANGINVDLLFDLLSLRPCLGVLQFAERLATWGWWGLVPGLEVKNLGFDSGFETQVGDGLPRGWIRQASTISESSASTERVCAGRAVKFGGSSGTAGDLVLAVGNNQQFIKKTFGAGLGIQPSTAYRIRGWAAFKLTGGSLDGQADLHIFLDTAGAGTGLLLNSANMTGANFMFFDVELTPGLSNMPAVVNLRMRAENITSTIGGIEFIVDGLNIYPADEPYETSTLRFSKATAPEAFDGSDGFLLVSPDDGQSIRSCFKLRDRFLYVVKEESLHVTTDNGGEPNTWTIDRVASGVGTPSVRGVGSSIDWAVIAHKSGLYFFDGGSPVKICDEIQPTWNRINWDEGHLIEVEVDVEDKQIYVSVPFDGATTNSRVFVASYRRWATPLQGRDWSIWNVSAQSIARVLRSAGKRRMLFGASSDRNVWELASGQFYDEIGAPVVQQAINGYWQSHYFDAAAREQFGYLTMRASGAGQLSLDVFRGAQADVRALRAFTLPADPRFMLERQLNIQRQKVSFRVGTNRAGEHFELTEFTPWVHPASWAPVRGR